MIYSHLLTCFPGWTWEYIDQHMTIPRLEEINRYQKGNPPIHVMVAAYFGIGKNSAKAECDDEGQSLFDLFPQSAQGGSGGC